MEKQRLLITVKTYPTLSKKYGETVCTAGVREDGSWVRLYPVPFRKLDEEQQYKKYDWIECEIIRNTKDPRPETFRPLNPDQMNPVGHMGTTFKWSERRRLLLQTATVYDRLDTVIDGAKSNKMSLAIFKPTKILGFSVRQEEDRNWDLKKLKEMRDSNSQLNLFEDNEWRKTFQVIAKLPYNFSYKFEDAVGRRSELQILDWEIGALYWKCLWSNDYDEQKAISLVRQKYMEEFQKTDLHFFLGTLRQFHGFSPNPWVIIGVMPIPFDDQLGLF